MKVGQGRAPQTGLNDAPTESGSAEPAEPSDKKKRLRLPSLRKAAEHFDPDDTYEQHDVKQTKLGKAADKIANKVAPIRTHERVIQDFSGTVAGIGVGVTVSQLELVRKDIHGREIVQVVNPDGSSNWELLLGRKYLGHNHRLELQGPALNTSVTPGELPLGARFIGVDLTSDVTSAMDHDALSYTVEVKLTERSIAEMAVVAGGTGAATEATHLLAHVAGDTVAKEVGGAILGAVPVLSAALAVSSARRAVVVMRDDTASKEMKAFAVAHAGFDTVRVFFPLAGVIGNAALVLVAAGLGWVHLKHAEHSEPIGPEGAKAHKKKRGKRGKDDAEAPPEAPDAAKDERRAGDVGEARSAREGPKPEPIAPVDSGEVSSAPRAPVGPEPKRGELDATAPQRSGADGPSEEPTLPAAALAPDAPSA